MSKENVNIPAQEPSGSTVTDPNTGIDINQERNSGQVEPRKNAGTIIHKSTSTIILLSMNSSNRLTTASTSLDRSLSRM
jgi:hypothetical protein